MKKRLLTLLLSAAMMLTLAACGQTGGEPSKEPAGDPTVTGPGPVSDKMKDLKIGFIHIGDESDKGYTYNMVMGTKEMQENLGITDDQLVVKVNIAENDQCADAINACLDAGAQLIFTTSFGFQDYALEAAKANPDVEFVQLTGNLATSSGLANMHNAFADIYEGRYLAGIVAGLKAKEIGNPVLGYVGAYPYAEVISGYTAFYQGAKSVYPEVTMKVTYTGSWNDPDKEGKVAQALIDLGCGVISQHSDSTAPATVAEQNGMFQVGYNADMIEAAPNAAMVSSRIDWGVYFTQTVQNFADGVAIPTDWTGGWAEGAVVLTALNETIAAPGTKEALEKAEAGLMDGSLQVFTGPMKGVDGFSGEELNLAAGEVFQESDVAGGKTSAPYFGYVIEGITIVE